MCCDSDQTNTFEKVVHDNHLVAILTLEKTEIVQITIDEYA